MRNRRFAIVAGLGVVEFWIIGLIIRSVGGGHETGFSPLTAHFASAAAAQSVPGGRTTKTLETGPAPHVVIDDDAATLRVSVRPGTSVAITEQTNAGGWPRGNTRPSTIEKTDDGVRIAQADRTSNAVVMSFGSVGRRLDVVVPPGALLDVQNAGPMTVSGLRADVTLHSDDGSIAVADIRGSVRVKTDNGRVELTDVEAPSIDVGSDNGHVAFDRVRADHVAVITDNGRIDVLRSLLRGGKIQTDSGRVRLALDPRSDVTVSATASAGKVIAQAPLTAVRAADDDDAPSTIRVGSGAGRLEVGSDDGSITVLAGGV